MDPRVKSEIEQFLRDHPECPSATLFSFLALLRAYVPESYLLMFQGQTFLGSPDPIHGYAPSDLIREPFTPLITVVDEQICLMDQETAHRALDLLANNGLSRSAIVQQLMASSFVDWFRPHINQYIKDLLTKREMGEKGENEEFSRLITDIKNKENLENAVSVLEAASERFPQDPHFPQTLSRCLYYKQLKPNYEEALRWAQVAIDRAPNDSYMADTLGQIYKIMLKNTDCNVTEMAGRALEAFKEEERKADGPDTGDVGAFNNGGFFGFIQVANIAFQKGFPIQNIEREVEEKFAFFEKYLTYSKPKRWKFEPDYFWKHVALCYQNYTNRSAAESTSFAGLLDWLNHGLVTSKGKRAGFLEAEKDVSDLERVQESLKAAYENNPNNAEAAETYILSNIILSNKSPDSPQITQTRELRDIINKFTEVGRRSPEFYLLALLLFWPEEPSEATHMLMEQAFERSQYARYLRGRYLLPLFFLGKGSGLNKWIHKSKLDAIVEQKLKAELHRVKKENDLLEWINQMWIEGEVWRIPEIQEILLPVEVELYQSPIAPQEQQDQEVLVHAGGFKIKATIEVDGEVSADGPWCYYLGCTIKGPVVFKRDQP